ncbi:ACT domain-containing protein [Nocardioides zeae]|uniref:ACT domain-containing protein n=1 Tax=Nocardioides imazamoxiresistens TaxID=3231893 RepID=A0ABU3PVX8_9ACTN|nr:ACT domain-containing protein [Nocardioides zeae]MDT9593396.1 ACT domain-containing protein [Nocardioides zeae]
MEPDPTPDRKADMPFLLRVELPDVPGSLGRVASAIGEAGGDIEAIEIVEHRPDGTAVDDVLLETQPGAMPDSIVSACTAIEGVRVIWISRYAAGGNLFLDLEAVEDLTAHPHEALDRLVDLMPVTFRADWAVRTRRAADGSAEVLHRTGAAPSTVSWFVVERPTRIDAEHDEINVLCGVPVEDEQIVVGRRGGPAFLDSELARMGHLVALAQSIARQA